MEGIQKTRADPIVVGLEGPSVALEIDLSVFELEAVFRACYKLTDRCYVFLARGEEDSRSLTVTLTSKSSYTVLSDLAGELCNELLDQQIRRSLFRESGALRELIVAEAFAEGNLLDPQRDEGNYEEDPLGIGQRP